MCFAAHHMLPAACPHPYAWTLSPPPPCPTPPHHHAPQAAALEQVANVRLALNLGLREEVLVEKCLGRRICKKCGKNYNVADIYLPASSDRPEIVMPPLNPPPECVEHMEQRSDDTEPVIRKRLEVRGGARAGVGACWGQALVRGVECRL